MPIVMSFGIFLLCLIRCWIYFSDKEQEMKETVARDYNMLLNACRNDKSALMWLSTLESRFENYINSSSYQLRKPCDKFRLSIPFSRSLNNRLLVLVVVDKKLDLKLVVDYDISKNDYRADKYLKYCIGYNCGLKEFIQKCQKTILSENIEEKRIKSIETLLNSK